MKKLSLILTISLLSACSATLPPPPEPEGKQTPVNPSVIYIPDLKV